MGSVGQEQTAEVRFCGNIRESYKVGDPRGLDRRKELSWLSWGPSTRPTASLEMCRTPWF